MTERRVPPSVLAALGLIGCGPCTPASVRPCLDVPMENAGADDPDAPPPATPPDPPEPPVGPCLEFAEPPPEEPPVRPCLSEAPEPPGQPEPPPEEPPLRPCLKIALPPEPEPEEKDDGGASLGPRDADDALATVLRRRVLPEDVAARLRARRGPGAA